MYTLLELQSKTFGQLKKIGHELNVLPEDDRRRRETWIDAIAGVNPPLLQLLETSPTAEVQAQELPIIETVEASPVAEDVQAQEPPIESKFGRIVYKRPSKLIATPKFKVGDLVQSKTMLWGIEKESLTGTVILVLPNGGVRVCFGDVSSGFGGTFDFSNSKLEDLIQVQEPIVPIDAFVNTPQRQEPIVPIDAFVNTPQRQEPIVPIDAFVNTPQRQEPIVQAAETSPGVEVEQAQDAIEPVLDEQLPSEEEARSIVSQYFISTALREIRNAPPPARVFFPGQHVRIIEVLECHNSQFCGSIGIVEGHYFNVWVWVELDGGARKIVLCRPEKLELIELVVEESATKQPIEIKSQKQIENSPDVEVEPVQEAIEPVAENSPGVEVEQAREPVIETVETSPGVEIEQVEEPLPNCVMCFGDGYIEDEFGSVKFCQCEPKLGVAQLWYAER